MYGRWRITSFPEEIWIARGLADPLPDSAELIPPEQAAWRIEAWVSGGAVPRHALAEIGADLGAGLPRRAPAARVAPGAAEDLAAAVREALRAGELRAYRLREAFTGIELDVPPPAPASQPAPVEQKTFVVIELLDDSEPPRPVPFRRYRVELPDSSVREGQLDASGQARISGIDPGTCKVSFPQIHGDDWKLA